nr:MAG TPA: hypothetical protein [Caudoviricetes sp.]
MVSTFDNLIRFHTVTIFVFSKTSALRSEPSAAKIRSVSYRGRR